MYKSQLEKEKIRTGAIVEKTSFLLRQPLIMLGALLQIGSGGWGTFFSFIAVLIASINIFGGFIVTQRMLKMFRKG